MIKYNYYHRKVHVAYSGGSAAIPVHPTCYINKGGQKFELSNKVFKNFTQNDNYYTVEANRLSPEFPIPIYLSPSEKPTYSAPGGAANVARQLTHFNVHSYLYGFWNKNLKKTC